ncbi:hypothetical protein ACKWTF_016234 [Chironomus riparius]
MPKSISVNYTSEISDFIEKFELEAASKKDYEVLIIKDIPKIANAFTLLSELNFKQQITYKPNLFGILFKVNERVNENQEEQPQIYDFKLKDKLLISFQSTIGKNGSKTFWKVPRIEKFKSIYIDDDEAQVIVHEFLVGEVKAGRTGIIEKFQLKSNVQLQDIGDSEGRNLLILATNRIETSAVKALLKHEFDADEGIDLAWNLIEQNNNNNERKSEIDEIILSLLKANSRFPEEFEYEKASEDVKKFVDKCESLHVDADEDDFDSLKVKLDSEPNLIHFYDRYNESLLAYSLKMQKFKIMEFLNRPITNGPHEDLNEIYENMNKSDKRKLREVHKSNAYQFPEIHVLILRTRSKIGNNDRFSNKKWKFVDEAYETLNKNDYCQKIMKLAAKFKKLRIYFDFKHDSTYYMDPATSYYSKGIIYEGGSIFIGALELADDDNKFKVFGVLAHELCYLAVYTGFMNRNFDPFPTGESDLKTRFVNRVMTQCRKHKEFEKTIANVFTSYSESIQDSEMIVTVPQMMMQYLNDKAKLEEIERIFEELFRYSREVVEPELDRALIMIEIIENEKKSVKFETLTEPMKARILHSAIEFQGVETSLFELIGDNIDILNLLEPKDITNILLNDKTIQISKKLSDPKSPIIERFFLDFEYYKYLMYPHVMTSSQSKQDAYESLKSQVEKYKFNFQTIHQGYMSPVVMIENHADIGKTTCMKNLVDKFKQVNKTSWVSFIALKNCLDVLQNIDRKIETFDEAANFILKLIKTDSKIESSILNKLFCEGKTIFLLDGVDEISHKAAEHLSQILELFVRNENKNRFWVSTRPNCSSVFSKKCYWRSVCSLVPLNDDEKKCYIKDILRNNNIIEESSQNKIINEITEITNHLEDLKERSNVVKEVHNLLMIQMVTELYIYKKVIFEPEKRYEMYLEMINMQKNKLGDKVPTLERDRDVKFTVWDVHRVLALKLILNYNFQNLRIMKKWEKFKHNWKSEMIQRYGFVTVDLENEEGSINFIHRTYAEFFVAQFFVEMIFFDGIDECVDQDELNEVASLFIVLIDEIKDDFRFNEFRTDDDKYKVIKDFMYSFIENNKSIAINSIKHFLKIVEQKVPKHYLESRLNWIVKFAKLTKNDPQISQKLWKEDKSNFFDQVLLNDEQNELTEGLNALCTGKIFWFKLE